MKSIYRKIMKMGDSYYMALPKALVTKRMLTDGVEVEILEAKPGVMVLKVSEALGEQPQSDQES
jgi:antitoxin component of MazEF toxin-antitoxin module